MEIQNPVERRGFFYPQIYAYFHESLIDVKYIIGSFVKYADFFKVETFHRNVSTMLKVNINLFVFQFGEVIMVLSMGVRIIADSGVSDLK